MMKGLRQKWKVKLTFRGAWNSLIAWPDWPWPPVLYDRSTLLPSLKGRQSRRHVVSRSRGRSSRFQTMTVPPASQDARRLSSWAKDTSRTASECPASVLMHALSALRSTSKKYTHMSSLPDTDTSPRQKVSSEWVSDWASSFLTAHQHTKYRRMRGDMIEVFKILHNYYDSEVSPKLTLNNASVTIGTV